MTGEFFASLCKQHSQKSKLVLKLDAKSLKSRQAANSAVKITLIAELFSSFPHLCCRHDTNLIHIYNYTIVQTHRRTTLRHVFCPSNRLLAFVLVSLRPSKWMNYRRHKFYQNFVAAFYSSSTWTYADNTKRLCLQITMVTRKNVHWS